MHEDHGWSFGSLVAGRGQVGIEQEGLLFASRGVEGGTILDVRSGLYLVKDRVDEAAGT